MRDGVVAGEPLFLRFVFRFSSFYFLVAREGAPSEPRPPLEPRPVRALRPARPKSSPEVIAPPPLTFETYLVGLPAVPTHGTPSAPVGVLLDWRSEVVSAQTELLHADAAHAAAIAAKQAADAAAKAAGANVRVAAARRKEAVKRSKHAWSTYTGFVGDVCLDTVGSQVVLRSSGRSVVVVGGKGKARAPSRSSAEEDEVVDLAELESGSEDKEEDIMVE